MEHHVPRIVPVYLARACRIAVLVGAMLAVHVSQGASQPVAPRRLNIPFIGATDAFAPAILWLGQVDGTRNYADVRAFYYDGHMRFYIHIFDRLLWHDSSPSSATIDAWDAVSVYISLSGRQGQSPTTASYRLVKQLGNTGAPGSQATFRGTGGGWAAGSVAFTATDNWRGNYPNDMSDDFGWVAEIDIPFSSLGLSGNPSPGTLWGLGLVVHDRDDAGGTPIPDQVWPETFQAAAPGTWGELRFGRPAHTPPASVVASTTTVRSGLNGATVADAAVGGHTTCGNSGQDTWTGWGDRNYAGYNQFNIQNQWDVSDFPCFSKYFVTFPLTAVPAGKAIVSARVKLNLFGNAGYNPGDAQPSSIEVLTVSDNWNESTITWNNAPRASENIGSTRVLPYDAAGNNTYLWDVTYAVAKAYAEGTALRLAFYSTDGDYHSGKYFWTSDSNDWGGTVRPTLEVSWASTGPPSAPTGVRVRVP